MAGAPLVPEFLAARDALLPLSHAVAHLPKEEQDKLVDEESLYNAGWSHGKEKLVDKPDFAKGSFYFNPLTDSPGTEEERRAHPSVYPKNRWPATLPELEPAAKRLGSIMKAATTHLAVHIDKYLSKLCSADDFAPGSFAHQMSITEKAKGRLLYYFPMDTDEPSEDSWIGWHNDSGFLTALAGDIFVNDETGEVVPNPEPGKAGLFVTNRAGQALKVDIPPDCMAVQCGECLQVISGGKLVATPHCVRGAKNPPGLRVARISCPCFIDTRGDYPLKLPSGVTVADVDKLTVSSKVPKLAGRFTNGQTFAEFLTETFKAYYSWAKQNQAAAA